MNFILKDFSFKELEQFIIDNGFSKYRAQQIYSWLYKHGATNSQMMHNLSDDLKLFLDQNCTFETLSLSNDIIFSYLKKSKSSLNSFFSKLFKPEISNFEIRGKLKFKRLILFTVTNIMKKNK